MTTRIPRTLAIVAAVSVLSFTSACGNDNEKKATTESARPTVAQLTEALQAKNSVLPVTDAAQAQCVAQVYHDSKLSNKFLKSIVEKNPDYKGSTADRNALSDVGIAMIQKCANAASGTPSTPSN